MINQISKLITKEKYQINTSSLELIHSTDAVNVLEVINDDSELHSTR